jgi:UDP-N-acetylglucosamine 4,6-dehydratase
MSLNNCYIANLTPKEKLMIIGGTGSLGHAIVEKYKNIYDITILSRDEDKQWKMKKKYPSLTFALCDIRFRNSIDACIKKYKPNIVIIASALKHIDICESNIDECIKTNILGIQNVIEACYNCDIKELNTVAFISTDKATSPVNVYGMCKSISERLVSEKYNTDTKIKFVSVRYGNVLNSRGSILPLFHDIGVNNERTFFPVTSDKMTRFFLTLEEAVNLIFKAILEGSNGDLYIPKANCYKIIDIANSFSEKYKKPIKLVGVRPGEKLHECLINETERYKTVMKDNVYVIKPYYIEEGKFGDKLEFETEYTSNLDLCKDKETINKLLDIN